jgi:predicted permease
MLIGIIAKRSNVITESIEKSISTLIMKIAMPALIITSSSIRYSKEIIPNMFNIFLITVISYTLFAVLGMLTSSLFKFDRESSSVYISLLVFANVGFMGFPLAKAVYGDIGVFYASIVNLVFTVGIWTYGILLYNSNGKIEWKNLLNIGTISSIIAIFMFLVQLQLPAPIMTALDLTGKMTTPLSMLMIGSLIAKINLKELFGDWKVYWVSLLKLIIFPLATALILKAFGYNKTVIDICTLMAAVPSAATNSIFANEFNVNPVFASIGVFITTMLCIVTLPFILYFLTLLV